MKANTLIAATLAAALPLAAPLAVSAAEVNPGTAQLAHELGVEPGAYSLSDLIRLSEAKRDGDAQAYDFLRSGRLSGVTRLGSTGADAQNPGVEQLARLAGVSASDYSLPDLARLLAAQEAGDRETAEAILNHQLGGGESAGNPGKAQLAAALGVNADDYTLSQLAAMYSAAISG